MHNFQAGLNRFNLHQVGQIGLLVLLLFTQVACQPQAAATSMPTFTLTARPATPTSAASSTNPPTPSATNQASPLPLTPTSFSPTSLSEPMRYVFPTPGQPPLSTWSPPLYPTPWAPTAYDHFYFARPIAANEANWPVADYRYGGEFFDNIVHTGVDFPASPGTPVLAAGSGEVIWAGIGLYRGGYDESDPYGQAIAIRHDFGYQGQALFTVYGHMERVDVAPGQHVKTGQAIGLVGESGKVTGPHLHFEVRLGENNFYATRNPELWLVPPIGWGVLAGRMLNSGGLTVAAQDIIVTSMANEQNWFGRSYGEGASISDSYYQENVVVGDLPAGRYRLRTAFAGRNFSLEVDIRPGVVNYFIFNGLAGFMQTTPQPPGADFTPQPWEATPQP